MFTILFYFLMFQGSFFHHFLYIRRTPSHSFRVSLLKVVFSENVNFPFLPEGCLLGKRFWLTVFFQRLKDTVLSSSGFHGFFSLTLSQLSYFRSSFASMVSDEKPTFILTVFSIGSMSFFSACFQDFFSLSYFSEV